MNAEYFKKLAAHDNWANLEFISALERMPEPPQRAMEVIAHIIAAEWVWLSRMNTEPQAMKVWPSLTFAECRVEMAKLKHGWKRFLGSADMDATFPYTNTTSKVALPTH